MRPLPVLVPALLLATLSGCTCQDPAPAPPPPRAILPPTSLDQVDLKPCSATAWVDVEVDEDLHVLGAPVADGLQLSLVSAGNRLTVDGVRGRWLRITSAHQADPETIRRWPMGAWIDRTGIRVRVLPHDGGDDVILRASPATDAEAVATLPLPDEGPLELIWDGCEGGWVRTVHDGKPAWVAPDDLCSAEGCGTPATP